MGFYPFNPPASSGGGGGMTVIGTPGPPTSLTYAAGATVIDSNKATWVCYAGGTPGSWLPIDGKNNPDWPPPSGNLGFDYEFNATTSSLPAGWSWFHQGSTTYTEGNGVGLLAAPSVTGFTGITQPLPTAPFTVTAKIRTSYFLDGTDYGKVGIFFTDGTKLLAFEQGGATGSMQNNVAVENYTDPNTFSGSAKNWTPTPFASYYLKVVYTTGSNVSFYVSNDGIGYFPFLTGYPLTGTGLTPTAFGLGIDGGISGTGAPQGSCQFFRVR